MIRLGGAVRGRSAGRVCCGVRTRKANGKLVRWRVTKPPRLKGRGGHRGSRLVRNWPLVRARDNLGRRGPRRKEWPAQKEGGAGRSESARPCRESSIPQSEWRVRTRSGQTEPRRR